MSAERLQFRLVTAALIVFALLVQASAAPRSQAAEVVTALELEGGENIHLYVDHETMQLKALATVEGASAKKDVTQSAVWTTSSETIVKVEKGKLTPVGAGKAKVTAKYGGKTAVVDVTVNYLYAAVKLSEDGPVQVELRDEPLILTASAVEEDGTEFDVTTTAVWTSSNSSVATVDKGKVQLRKAGTVTITVKYKGRSDSIVYHVTSPYRNLAIEWSGGAEFDFFVGQDGVKLEATAELVNGTKEDATDTAVWTSSNPSVVEVEKGELTFKSQGVAEITASRFGHTAKVSVVVRLPYQALILNPAKPIYLFATDAPVMVTAEVANDFSTRYGVTHLAEWTTSNPLAATVNNGLIRPHAPGAAEVTVSYKGLSKKIPVTVMPVVDDLRLDRSEIQLFKGEVADVPDVYGTDLNGTEYSFAQLAEWSSSDEEVVVVEDGKLKAKKPGKAVVTMTIRGKTDTLRVEVLEKALALFPSASSYALVRGDAVAKPAVTALFEDGTEIDVTNDIEWTSSSPNLLVEGNRFRALLHSQSKVTLTGTYLNKKIAIPVTIEDRMTNIKVETPAIELNPKKSRALKVTATDSAGNTVNVSKNVVWTSSDPAVAEVSGSTVKAVAEGSATLTAVYQGKTLTVSVSVVPKLEKLALSVKSEKLAAGKTTVIRAIAYFDNGTTKDVTEEAVWTSSNALVGKIAAGKFTALKKGAVTVKAKYQNKTASARVTVTEN